MIFMVKTFLPVIFLLTAMKGTAYTQTNDDQLLTGADQTDKYLPLLEGKRVGLFVNHTSVIRQTHLTDSLLSMGISIQRVFSPEHGFRGNQPDGEQIDGEHSEAFELVSLYGQTRRPAGEQITDLDILVVDIQDVGVRCYTYASTMTYLMEACAEYDVPVLVLDRPNPNGSYVDGPVLDEHFESFVGLHPIPLVHGLTLGELALMINGEGWLENSLECRLQVIPVVNWKHNDAYSLPVNPSPNLPNDLAVALYPSLTLFEGTVVSVGRGTDYPFQVIGHPKYTLGAFSFTPHPNEASKYPPLDDQQCFGISLINQEIDYRFTLSHLLNFYHGLKDKIDGDFFNGYFVRLAGTDQLQKQIEAGWSEEKICKSWQNDLANYKKMRQKYLIYE